MIMEKLTYTKALEAVLTGAELTDEIKDKLVALKDQLVKRNATKAGKPTKAQREAAEFTETVYAALTDKTDAVRCGDLAKDLDVSGQKVSAALTKLVKAGRVAKVEGEKRAVLFRIA